MNIKKIFKALNLIEIYFLIVNASITSYLINIAHFQSNLFNFFIAFCLGSFIQLIIEVLLKYLSDNKN